MNQVTLVTFSSYRGSMLWKNNVLVKDNISYFEADKEAFYVYASNGGSDSPSKGGVIFKMSLADCDFMMLHEDSLKQPPLCPDCQRERFDNWDRCTNKFHLPNPEL